MKPMILDCDFKEAYKIYYKRVKDNIVSNRYEHIAICGYLVKESFFYAIEYDHVYDGLNVGRVILEEVDNDYIRERKINKIFK